MLYLFLDHPTDRHSPDLILRVTLAILPAKTSLGTVHLASGVDHGGGAVYLLLPHRGRILLLSRATQTALT